MNEVVRRGYFPNDEKEFSGIAVQKLHKAGCDLYYLINQGYPIKGTSVFVGNHYLLSERQRLALVRAISPEKSIELRRRKEIKSGLENSIIHIDGFNTIITLEIAFSASTLLKCMDGTIRDLAGLRGTYRLIDKTNLAIMGIGEVLEVKKIKKAVFYLDAPVSNSGKLKERIVQLLEPFSFEVQVEVTHNVDAVLEMLDYVVTSDAIILDKCTSWVNLTKEIIERKVGCYPYINLNLRC
ncbi:MAG: DUF434 domain-containing protein [Cellulosilyticum sp.]|nr:DUF434 domain-containing protein [Cellulosilyticum sp.]